MRHRPFLLLGAFCALGVIGSLLAAPGVQAEPEATGLSAGAVELKHKGFRTFAFVLPEPRFLPVSGGFDFREVGGANFKATLDGEALQVDTDGDGEVDTKLEGKDAFLRLKAANGFRYAARLVNTPRGWMYAPGGALVGKIGETRITLIDQDGNGRHGDKADAMIVGRSDHATWFSQVVNVDGQLHTIRIAKDGRQLHHEPYAGAAGTLDGVQKHRADAKLLAAIVRSEDGAHSFDLAKAEKGLRVPAGRYLLQGGALGLGDNLVRFRQGKTPALEVKPDSTRVLAWGAPLRADFAYERKGDEVHFDPRNVRYFGAAGEEYIDWHPCGKSPEFRIVDAQKATEIATAIFAGNC